eukprot:7484021-Pyramimonas_sp.AAC.1
MLLPLAAAINSTVTNTKAPQRLHFHIMLPRNKPLPRKENLDKLMDRVLGGRGSMTTLHKVDVSYIMDKMKINFKGYVPLLSGLLFTPDEPVSLVLHQLSSFLPSIFRKFSFLGKKHRLTRRSTVLSARYGPSKAYLKSELNYVRFELPDLLPALTKVR